MIYQLRHGQTEFNVERRIQGRSDSPLTALGRSQAHAMGLRLRQLLGDETGFTIVSSPLPRARLSAAIVAEAAGIDGPIIEDERLQEVGCGSWEKQQFAALAESDPAIGEAPNFLYAWARHCPDGEMLEEACDRLASWLDWARGRSLVAVGHGCSGSILRALFAGSDRDVLLRCRSSPQDRFHALHRGGVEEIRA